MAKKQFQKKKKKLVNVNTDQGDTKRQMKKQRKTDRRGQKCFRKRRKRRRNLVNRMKIKIQKEEDDSEQWKRRKTEEDNCGTREQYMRVLFIVEWSTIVG